MLRTTFAQVPWRRDGRLLRNVEALDRDPALTLEWNDSRGGWVPKKRRVAETWCWIHNCRTSASRA